MEENMENEIDFDANAQLRALMEERYVQLVDVYFKSAREHMERIGRGLEAGDAAMIVESAHSMKSVSGNMGLMGLSQAAQRLEDAAKGAEGDISALKPLVADMQGLFTRGEAFLQESLNLE